MGGMSGLMAMLPGVAKIKNQLAERNIDDGILKRQMALIDSMTPGERKNPDILKASRKKRVATGAGSKVEELNKLLKMHRNMADVMKAMGGGKARGPMAGLARMMGMGGGMPSPEEMQKLAEKMPGGLPPGMPGMPGTPPAGSSGLPGGLGKFPGLGGGGAPKLPTPGGLPPDFFKKK
jgi:signal recognition particle subunit SRP54